MHLDEDELRQVAHYAAACARRALPVFEAAHPHDPRPRDAIAAAEAFAAGGKRTAALRKAAWSAYAAARDAAPAPAANAAYAASHAAAAAFLHPRATPHQVKHVLGAAVHQALALAPNTGNESDDGGDGGSTTGRAPLDGAAALASPAVRRVLHRFPSPRRGRTRFGELLSDLDAALRT
ncbi:MAG: exonuclease SbcC [Proteobacteria bacterium]|nr:exonuclease SbcC [Pseudomonadota bacterium]